MGHLTVSQALQRLRIELERLGATDCVTSTNVELTRYGTPYSGRKPPEDIGVAVYFKLGAPRVLACDAFDTVADNIAAIAAHIDCLRGIERYGVGTIEQAFTGYTALPPPGADNRAPWRKVFGFENALSVTPEGVRFAYRAMAKQNATNEDYLKVLNLARDEALKELNA